MCSKPTIQQALVQSFRGRLRGCLPDTDMLEQIAGLLRRQYGHRVWLFEVADLLKLTDEQARLARGEFCSLDLRPNPACALRLLARQYGGGHSLL